MANNPYSPPRAAVSDVETDQEYQEIRIWPPSGRLGRLRYLAYGTGTSLLAGIVAGALGPVLGPTLGMSVVAIIYIVAIVFSVLVGIQRSHDMDWSGWMMLLGLIPFVGLIWIFKAGSEGPNRFGAPPPPNSLGVKILGWILPAVFIIGIVAAIAIPAYVEYTRRAAGG